VTYSCASCGALAAADAGCAHCGRSADPDAVEVARTDAEITQLIARLAAARRAVEDLDERIDDAWNRRNAAASRLRRRAAAPGPSRPAKLTDTRHWWRFPALIVVRAMRRPAVSADQGPRARSRIRIP